MPGKVLDAAEGGLSEAPPTLAGFTAGWRSSGFCCLGTFLVSLSVCLSLACQALPASPEGWIPEEAELDGWTDGSVAFSAPGRTSEGLGCSHHSLLCCLDFLDEIL